MHTAAMQQMTAILRQHLPDGPGTLLDVGALDINGTYRPLVEGLGWHYTGLDLVAGKNVDVVAEDAYRYPFPDARFGAVISGSTLEHVEALWRWVPELARVLRPGGLLAIITHTQWEHHPYPVDCWRVLPDGMKYLFDLTAALERYEIEMYNATDISGVAWKRAKGR